MLKKLAAGELSLKLTFWVFGLLGFFIFFIITSITHAGLLKYICPVGQVCSRNVLFFVASNFINLLMHGSQSGIMLYLTSHILLSAGFIVYMYITLRGLWKTAATYEGKALWVWCAKMILVCVAVLSLRAII